MSKLAVWGWWQGKNLGDNWIKNILYKIFPEADFIDTRETDFEQYKFVICGGGGLFINDVIPPWKHFSQKVSFGMLGLGAEFPHYSREARELNAKADFFYLRDLYSMDCMHLGHIQRSFDVTFYQPLPWIEEETIHPNRLFFVWRDGKSLLKDPRFQAYIQYQDSRPAWDEVINQWFSDVIYDDFQTEDSNISERMENCGFVISGRYHGIVAAIQKGLPFIAIDICPKIRALLKECGLEQYCLKISDVAQAGRLIRDALEHIQEIREKEWRYRLMANQTLKLQISEIRNIIYKKLNDLKVLHYGSYWMRENDVVHVMADSLSHMCSLKKIDLKIYETHMDSRVKTKLSTPNGCLCVLDGERIIEDMKRYDPDCIILNSGGLTLEDNAFEYAEENGIVTAGISLSDPDVYPYNGQLYAHKFDLFYTNARYSIRNQYQKTGVSARLLPFAASESHHYYMPEIKKDFDIVIVGHARKDRLEIVRQLSPEFKVGTFGNGWEESLGVVNGIEHVKALNRGTMYLSFAQTVAGYQNIKVGLFEAMACKQVVITQYMDELNDYFEIGSEILCYRDSSQLLDLVRYYMQHPEEREAVREKAYHRFLSEHTYEKRWENVLNDIQKRMSRHRYFPENNKKEREDPYQCIAHDTGKRR